MFSVQSNKPGRDAPPALPTNASAPGITSHGSVLPLPTLRPSMSLVMAFLAFFILPNLPYWWWLGQFTPTRAVVNIDYLVLGILAPLLPSSLLITGFMIIATVDAFVFVSMLYHFTPRELAMSMSYARYSPIKLHDLPLSSIVFSMLTLAAAIVMALATRPAARRWIVSLMLSTLLVTIILADVFNGTNTFGPLTRLPFYTRIQHVAANPANSGLLASDPASFLPFGTPPSMVHMGSASQVALEGWGDLPRREKAGTNVALILVESWGRIEGRQALIRAIAAPLFTPAVAARYDVKVGMVPFKGSTTNAELRELCGLHGSYRDLFNLPRFRCLPDIFTQHGYNAIGMHGFHGDMFDRASWWPHVGLTQRLFLEDFRRLGYTRTCGTAFPGLCDEDLLAAMGDRLTASKQFVYALTINSHLPLAPVGDTDGEFRCSAADIQFHDEGCALAQHWHRVMAAIARNALRSDIKPTQFIIVGDHSPPLLGTTNQNFSGSTVPYILLTPHILK